jgi:hypothetical protein
VLSFRLRVEGESGTLAAAGCEIGIVALGAAAEVAGVETGSEVLVTGALAERRWQERGGLRRSRLEVLAASIRLL